MKKEVAIQVPFPLLGILGVTFIIMKLARIGIVADWSWWMVLSPFLALPAVLLVFLFVAILIGILGQLFDE